MAPCSLYSESSQSLNPNRILSLLFKTPQGLRTSPRKPEVFAMAPKSVDLASSTSWPYFAPFFPFLVITPTALVLLFPRPRGLTSPTGPLCWLFPGLFPHFLQIFNSNGLLTAPPSLPSPPPFNILFFLLSTYHHTEPTISFRLSVSFLPAPPPASTPSSRGAGVCPVFSLLSLLPDQRR